MIGPVWRCGLDVPIKEFHPAGQSPAGVTSCGQILSATITKLTKPSLKGTTTQCIFQPRMSLKSYCLIQVQKNPRLSR